MAAIDKYGVADQISYISTGGGAFLEFVEGRGRGLFDHVAQFFRGFAYAVHDDENNRLFHCSKILLKKYSTGENLVGWDGCPSPPHRIVYFFTDVKGQGRLKGINTREKR